MKRLHCATCGYSEDTHDLGTRRCHPLTADKNGRRGTFRQPVDEPRTLWHGLWALPMRSAIEAVAEAEPEPVVSGPPQVPARPPQVPSEIAGAGGGRQATKLGRLAQDLGWTVGALYWRSHEGVEGCALRLARDDLRIVMTWKRPAGRVGELAGWAADVAYAWRLNSGSFPTKLPHTQVEGLLNYGRDDDGATQP